MTYFLVIGRLKLVTKPFLVFFKRMRNSGEYVPVMLYAVLSKGRLLAHIPLIRVNLKILIYPFRFATNVYNAASDTWMPASPSAFHRLGPGLVNVNGRIFAQGALSTSVNVVEEFSSADFSW